LPIPANVNIRFFLTDVADPQILAAIPLDKIPATATIATAKLPLGDHIVCAQVLIESDAIAQFGFTISVVPRYRQRIDALKLAINERSATATLESSTANGLLGLLQSFAARDVPETDFPLARLLDEAEKITSPDAKDKPYYTPDRPGQFWLNLPFANGEVRVFIPEGLSKDRPVPVVVAMHGAGGSENMFFDTYGDGATLRQCRERGWILIGTRAVGFFNGGPPVGRIVEELAQRYPIDLKRVFIMGHSMGAAQTIEAVQKYPGKFAAAAALGGGASARNVEALKNLPVYVACGSEDFALSAAKALVRSLEKAEAKVQYHEYPKIEHIVIVQAAISELFAFFESAGR
jgi:predicted esterase